MTDEATLKRAIATGHALRRRLSPCHDLIHIPDMALALVVTWWTPTPPFDYSKCGRMSRQAAHKAINLMAGTAPMKAFYHDLVDGKKGGVE